MIKMAYRKRNKGAELSIRHDSTNTIDISTHYYNKSTYYDINLKDKTTEITYCARKVPSGHKPVKWRENWLNNRFINFHIISSSKFPERGLTTSFKSYAFVDLILC